jgi:hypothetical protein
MTQKSVDELKDLVGWAEAAGLKQVKIGNIEFVFSDYQLAKRVMSELSPAPTTPAKPNDAKDITNSDQPVRPEDDPDLFWSTTT